MMLILFCCMSSLLSRILMFAVTLSKIIPYFDHASVIYTWAFTYENLTYVPLYFSTNMVPKLSFLIPSSKHLTIHFFAILCLPMIFYIFCCTKFVIFSSQGFQLSLLHIHSKQLSTHKLPRTVSDL